MARFRAGYEADYGLRDFDSHRPRFDVGSRGYDRGYRQRLDTFGSGYTRPWTGGYHEGYQGGSEGIAMNTAPTGGAWVRGEGAPRTSGYDRDFRAGREYGGRNRGYGEGGDRGPGLNTGRYDRDLRGSQDRGGWTRPGSQRGFDQGDQGYAGGGGEYDPRYARGRRPGGGGYDRGFDRR
ncbi:MAG TPA: hypothetical protein VF615_00900 [Longimicrobiaceae bacterium]|jgi:hypothetical protein